jgi:hypothetical protein
MTVERILQSAVGAAIARAASATGADFSQLLATAQRESSLDPNARAGTSSATGLFQFIESTWLDMVARHGAKHGLAREAAAIDRSSGRSRVADPEQRAAILALRRDPELSARFAAELTRENAADLADRLGRPASAGEVYAAHVLGPAGAERLIRAAAAGAGDARAIFPKEAAANHALFHDRGGAPRSAAALLERFGAAPANPIAAPAPEAPAARQLYAPDKGGEAMLMDLLAHVLGLEEFGLGAGDAASPPELRLLANDAYRDAGRTRLKPFP